MSFQALEGPDSYNSILWRVQVPLLDFNQCNRVLSSVLSLYLCTNVRDTLVSTLRTTSGRGNRRRAGGAYRIGGEGAATHDVPDLLQRAIDTQAEREQQLLEAMAVCHPDGFWLPLAGRSANLLGV